jgi:hypothetical protein
MPAAGTKPTDFDLLAQERLFLLENQSNISSYSIKPIARLR